MHSSCQAPKPTGCSVALDQGRYAWRHEHDSVLLVLIHEIQKHLPDSFRIYTGYLSSATNNIQVHLLVASLAWKLRRQIQPDHQCTGLTVDPITIEIVACTALTEFLMLELLQCGICQIPFMVIF